MRRLNLVVIIAVFSCFSGYGQMISSQSFNSIRSFHCFDGQLNNALMDRIVLNKYNYVTVEIGARKSDDIYGNKDVFVNLKNDVKRLAEQLHTNGLRLIPQFSMSNQWALTNWKTLQLYENSSIGINSMTVNTNTYDVIGENEMCKYAGNTTTANRGSNSWAPEPNGTDLTMIEVYQAIKTGFLEANINYPLEFIHLGHDEPQFLNWCMIAGAGSNCESAYPYAGNMAKGETSSADLNYIDLKRKAGISNGAAYQMLLADEICRRISQANSVFGSSVKIMIYGDSFDSQSWGGVKLWHQFGFGSKITLSGVIGLPGLTTEQKALVKNQLILIMWTNEGGKVAQFTNPATYLTRPDYNTNSLFLSLKNNGYKFMYLGGNMSSDNQKQTKEYASTSRSYKDNCVGYMCVDWNSSPNWNIIEFMYSSCGNNANLPVDDFAPGPGSKVLPILQTIIGK